MQTAVITTPLAEIHDTRQPVSTALEGLGAVVALHQPLTPAREDAA